MSAKTFAQKLKNLFGIRKMPDDDFFEELTDILIEGDIGIKTASEIEQNLKSECKKRKISSNDDVIPILQEILLEFVKPCSLVPEPSKLSVYLVLGVNGVGKTTSIAKMAKYYNSTSLPVILAAADTFRAAAIEQLQYHGQKTGIRVVFHKTGGDPAAVVFDACDAASKSGGLILADTAGRLHNKENLVRELQKIDRIAKAKASEGCYKKILVLDATTGQNGFRQAEVFNEAVGIDAIVLAKYDSTAKGGIAITVGKELNIPVLFTGTGERYEDLAPFDPQKYVKEFLGVL